jgi:shikimate dehydrogenase
LLKHTVISGSTQLLGVIGYPIAHSLSPLMHNAAIAHLNQSNPSSSHQSGYQSGRQDFVYLPLPVAAEGLADAIAGFTAIGLRGFNITIPHKQAVMPLLDEVSDIARNIGAVNTVWREGDRWCGTNTDAAGFMAPLLALGRDWSTAPALVLGNGGAARAVVAACHELGCPKIWVAGRSEPKLVAFAESWSSPLADKLGVLPWTALSEYLPQAALVVNTTPVGMHPREGDCPLSDREISLLSLDAIVYDLIYTPRPTKLLQQASAAGLTAIDGLEMLVQQGAAALEIWLGEPAPVAVMRQALLTHLAQT